MNQKRKIISAQLLTCDSFDWNNYQNTVEHQMKMYCMYHDKSQMRVHQLP